MQTIVIGHLNPDMDSIVSAIAYADLKRRTGEKDVIAARCGSTNIRIDHVLKKFGVEPPIFFSDVRPCVKDVMERDVMIARVGSPIYDAMVRIGERKFRGLPVVDHAGRCFGLISAFKISQYLFPPIDRIGSAREVDASIENICQTIHGTIMTGDLCSEQRSLILVVAAMYTNSFERRIASLDHSRVVLIVGDRFNIQLISIKAGVRAIIVTGGLEIGEDVLEAAKATGAAIISSPYDTATTVLLARGAVTAEKMLFEDFKSLEPDTPIDDARSLVTMSSQFAFPVLAEDGTLQGILSKSDFLKPIPRRLVLVDHNEMSQAVPGASEVPIAEILDHHRIGNISTDAPILFINQPVGSTSTIIATQYRQANIPIPKPIAGILMAGVISDTLNLTSPTTTDVDREVLQELSEITGITGTQLAEEIFSIGSPLLTLSADQAITADCKEYAERGRRFSVAQIEELTFAHFEDKKAALLNALEDFRASKNLCFSVLLVTDINTQNSLLLVRGSEQFTALIDYPDVEPCIWNLPGVVSRKKQLLPYLTGLIAKLKS